MSYRINRFLRRLKKACRWWWFFMKDTPWQEYDQLCRVIGRQLLDMAKEFETHPITMSSEQDAKRMRLAAELLRRSVEEYYADKYWDLSKDPEKVKQREIMKGSDCFTMNVFKDGLDFNYVLENGYRRDEKACELAFRIISQDMKGWWQ